MTHSKWLPERILVLRFEGIPGVIFERETFLNYVTLRGGRQRQSQPVNFHLHSRSGRPSGAFFRHRFTCGIRSAQENKIRRNSMQLCFNNTILLASSVLSAEQRARSWNLGLPTTYGCFRSAGWSAGLSGFKTGKSFGGKLRRQEDHHDGSELIWFRRWWFASKQQ